VRTGRWDLDCFYPSACSLEFHLSDGSISNRFHLNSLFANCNNANTEQPPPPTWNHLTLNSTTQEPAQVDQHAMNYTFFEVFVRGKVVDPPEEKYWEKFDMGRTLNFGKWIDMRMMRGGGGSRVWLICGIPSPIPSTLCPQLTGGDWFKIKAIKLPTAVR